MPALYVRRVVELANQELASTATPEPIHNITDIIEIDESTLNNYGSLGLQLVKNCLILSL